MVKVLCAPVLLGLLLIGCGTDRDARASGEFFACDAPADCLSGYDCVCGWCQPAGATPVGCGLRDGFGADASAGDSSSVDTGTTDTGATDTGATDTGATDAGKDSSDTSGTSCSPLTWSGCPSGQGCYFDEGSASSFCLGHGSAGLGDACQPNASTPPCGRDKAGAPLLCDTVELKCQPLCKTSKANCPNGWQCYALGAQTRWADETGICAP